MTQAAHRLCHSRSVQFLSDGSVTAWLRVYRGVEYISAAHEASLHRSLFALEGGPPKPRVVAVHFSFFRALNLPSIDALVKGFMSTYFVFRCCITHCRTDPDEGQFTPVTASAASKDGEQLCAWSDQAEIANVMTKWDTKIGACNKEPHTDTIVHTPIYAQTHRNHEHIHTHPRTRTPHYCDTCPVC